MSSDDTRLVHLGDADRILTGYALSSGAFTFEDARAALRDAARRADPDDQHINVPRGIAEDAATLLEDFADDEEGAPEDTDRHAARVVARRLRALADAHPNQEPA